MAAAANAGNKGAANAALARMKKAVANRKALVGAPANAGLGPILAKANVNVKRAVQVARQKKNAEEAAAKEAANANKAAKAAAAKAAANANKAAKAAAAQAAAEAKAAAAAQATAAAKTAAEAEAARKVQEAAAKKARNAAEAQAKAAAAAANAAKKAEAAKIREFVLKLWPLTKGNFRGGAWQPRLTEATYIKQQISKFNPGLTVSQRNAIIANIIKAEKNKAIGHWGPYGAGGQNKNLTQRIERARALVNLVIPPLSVQEAAAAKIGQAWRTRKSNMTAQVLQNTVKAAQAVQVRAAAAVPGGATKAQKLAKEMRLAKIDENLQSIFINGQGQINNQNNYKKINKTLLQGLTKNEIVAHLKGVNEFKSKFTNANLEKMAQYFSP